MTKNFAERYGPWALVTGAAKGLGEEFSRQLAGQGLNIVLVDVDSEALEQTAESIRRDSGQQCRTVVLDLTANDFLAELQQAIAGLDVGLLVNNAGIGGIGPFLQSDTAMQERVLLLNTRAPMLLTHALLPAMVARGKGGVIFLSSLSGAQGTALVANYAATKAWNHVFAESLWDELRGTGVDALGILVGATRTPAFMNSKPNLERAGFVPVMDVEETVRDALNQLGKTPSAPIGRLNRVLNLLMVKLLPRRLLIRLGSDAMRKLYGD